MSASAIRPPATLAPVLPKPSLHRFFTQLRTELRGGAASPDTPSHLLHTARTWDTLERLARDPNPSEDILRVCGLVSECAAGMLHTRRQVSVVLERLAQASAEDLGRMERALADFCGLDPLEYYRACQLAIWTETDRVRPNGGRIPEVIAQQVAKAVEDNVPPDLHVGGVSGWEPFVLAHVPLPEGLRMVQVASDRTCTTALLRSLHPEEHPDPPSGDSPNPKVASLAIQERDSVSLRTWVSALPGNKGLKDRWLSVLVPALAEAGRMEEAFEYLEEIVSQSVREAVACSAVSLCAEAGYETTARAFLSHLAPGLNRIRCRVELMEAKLRLAGDTAAAVAEMEAIEEEAAGEHRRVEQDETAAHSKPPPASLSGAVRRSLAAGWTSVVRARLNAGEFFEAVDAAKHVSHEFSRSGCMGRILAEAQRRISTSETLRFAKAVLRASEEYNAYGHIRFVLRETIEFLARSGSAAALQFALDLIEEKMAGAENATCEEHRQNALRIFCALPPSELSWEETAAVGDGISSATTRADCLYALALHAAVEGEWEQSNRLEQRAERLLKAAGRKPAEAQPCDGSDEWEEKPGIPEMLRWMRSRQHSEGIQSEPNQWFWEAITLAVSLRHFREEALYAVGCLLIESPAFPERGYLYRQVLEKMEGFSSVFSTSLLRNELDSRAATAFLDPAAPSLQDLEQTAEDNEKTRPAELAKETAVPHPRLLRKKFTAALAQIEEGRSSGVFVSNFLEAAAPRILHPIRKPVVEALFEAAQRIGSTHGKARFSALVHVLAQERGESAEAIWVADTARKFALKSGVVSEYEAERKKILPIEAGGEAQPRRGDLPERISALEFEAAFAEFVAEPTAPPRAWNAHLLFEKALATGDSKAFFRAFELIEEAFAIMISAGSGSSIFEHACEWPPQIGKLRSRADRLHLLRRMWNWHDWFQLHDDENCGFLFVPAWAGQMAAAGEIDLALEMVDRLRGLEHRANGYAHVAAGCGLTRGDTRAAEIFARFVDAAKQAAAAEEYQFGADLGVRRIAMVCAEEGDQHHLQEAVALGRDMLLMKRNGDASFCLLMHLLEALALANRTDAWGKLLDCLIQSKQTTRWHSGQMSSVVSSLWKSCRHDPKTFKLSDRLGFLERFCVMMAAVRPVKQWWYTEARLLQICISQSEDVPQILERFEAVSSCSPEMVDSLLGQSFALRPDQDSPTGPDDQMLRWLANLSPYSEEAAYRLIGHVAGRCLHENDWSAILTLAKECYSLDLDWLKNIAEAVLVGE